MINIFISLAAGLVIGAATAFAGFGWGGAIFPALATTSLVFWLLWKKTNAKIEAAVMSAYAELQKGKPVNIDNAIRQLEAAKAKYSKVQIFTASSMDAAIGSILFLKKDFKKAKPYLERAIVRQWEAKAMLGVLHYKKKDFEALDKTFEEAARFSKKQGLLYSAWAWMHWKAGHTEKAIEILARGKEALGESDPHLLANLLNLQNGKKMKMKPYGERWYQFHLEQPKLAMQAQRGGARFARR